MPVLACDAGTVQAIAPDQLGFNAPAMSTVDNKKCPSPADFIKAASYLNH